MSRPAQLEQQMNRVKEIQAEMLGEVKPPVITDGQTLPEEPVAPTTTVESPATVSKEEFDKLEQRYRTLQGMHAADGQRARSEVASLQTALQNLEDRLIAAEKASKPNVLTPTRYVTDDDEKEYGDTLDMVRRAAKEEAEAIAYKREAEYLERIANLERSIGHVQNTVVPTVESLTRGQQEQVKAEFWGAINTQVPDWRTINEDAAFKSWLLAEDPITGATRQQFLSRARSDYDALRVIKFFQEWKRTQAGGQTPAPNSAQVELAKLVAPGTSRGTGNPTQVEKKQWTRDGIADFYKDVQLGKYTNKPDERKKIEADIFLAQKENRIT